MQGQSELEPRAARRMIREHHDNPNDFRFTRTQTKRGATGTFFFVKEYTVVVLRRKASTVTYEGGPGKNWGVVFAHDLATHRFSESTGG